MQLSGLCDEAARHQVNFIFHEGRPRGKMVRALTVKMLLSMIDNNLDNYFKKRVLVMLADNCVGQNRNWSVTAYIAWWVIVSFTDEVSLSVRTVGQSRCSANGYFALLKKSVGFNEDCETMINESCCHRSAASLLALAGIGRLPSSSSQLKASLDTSASLFLGRIPALLSSSVAVTERPTPFSS